MELDLVLLSWRTVIFQRKEGLEHTDWFEAFNSTKRLNVSKLLCLHNSKYEHFEMKGLHCRLSRLLCKGKQQEVKLNLKPRWSAGQSEGSLRADVVCFISVCSARGGTFYVFIILHLHYVLLPCWMSRVESFLLCYPFFFIVMPTCFLFMSCVTCCQWWFIQ